MTELVRRFVEQGLLDPKTGVFDPEAVEILIGFARDTAHDVAEHHDEYLAQALRRRRRA